MDLPAGATPLDLSYHVHTMVGHRCRGAKVNGLLDFLEKETEIPVELFNPFHKIEGNPKKIDPAYLQGIGPEMAIATGIALRTSEI